MKKINKVFISASLVCSCVLPSSVLKVNAEVNPFALIETIYDDEPNNYLTNNNYLFGNGTITDLTSFGRKSGEVGGTIRNSSDVDFFKFNIYSDSTLSIYLTAYDSSMNNILNYNFTLYKQVNGLNPSPNNSIALATTNVSGTNESYYTTVVPGTYYVKVFGDNGYYNSRQSYKLSYSVTPETKHTLDINSYCLSNPNSYVIWSSDFNYFESKKMNNVAGVYLGTRTNVDEIEHDVLNHFYNTNGFPNLGMYIWGTNFRNTLYNEAQKMLTKLYYQRDVMNRGNQKIQFVTNIVNNTSVELTGIDLLGNVLFTEWFNFSNLLQIPIFLGFINTGTVSSTIPISDLIVSFSVISTALATSPTTSESEIVALTQISKVERNSYTGEIYVTNTFRAVNTDISNSSRFTGTCISDNLGYNSDIGHINIFGDIYYPSESSSLFN